METSRKEKIMLPLVVKYLKTHSLQELKEDHGIRFHISGHKVSLNYSQIESDDADPMAQQCRGLILGTFDGSELHTNEALNNVLVLAWPFNRFFAMEQKGLAAPVDFNSADTSFFEKLDGTCCILYFDRVTSEWCVATRAVPNADLPMDGFGRTTFRELFEHAVRDTMKMDFSKFVEIFDESLTYVLELTTPDNRIVVNYKDYKVTLLGARNFVSGEEELLHHLVVYFEDSDLPIVASYRFGNVSEMIEFVRTRSATEHEGLVVCDKDFNRVKVKNSEYCALNRLQDTLVKSPLQLLSIILDEKLDDVSYVLPPHTLERAGKMKNGIKKLSIELNRAYQECLDVAKCYDDAKEARKHFALSALARDFWLPPLMDRYTGGSTNFIEWVMHNKNKKETKRDLSWGTGFLKMVYNRIMVLEKVDN